MSPRQGGYRTAPLYVGFLQEINEQGTTIILTTHYLEEAEMLCRNIAIINQGTIVENTSMKALLKQLDKETLVFDTRAF